MNMNEYEEMVELLTGRYMKRELLNIITKDDIFLVNMGTARYYDTFILLKTESSDVMIPVSEIIRIEAIDPIPKRVKQTHLAQLLPKESSGRTSLFSF